MDFLDDVDKVELEVNPEVAVFASNAQGEFVRLAEAEIEKRKELADKYESMGSERDREKYLSGLPLEHFRILLNELISRACTRRFQELAFSF